MRHLTLDVRCRLSRLDEREESVFDLCEEDKTEPVTATAAAASRAFRRPVATLRVFSLAVFGERKYAVAALTTIDEKLRTFGSERTRFVCHLSATDSGNDAFVRQAILVVGDRQLISFVVWQFDGDYDPSREPLPGPGGKPYAKDFLVKALRPYTLLEHPWTSEQRSRDVRVIICDTHDDADEQNALIRQAEALLTLTPELGRGLIVHQLLRRAQAAGQKVVDQRRAACKRQPTEAEREEHLPEPGTVGRGVSHPDLALARLVARGVITHDEADLIGRHRIEGVTLRRLGAERGWYPMQATRALRSAERKVARALGHAQPGSARRAAVHTAEA